MSRVLFIGGVADGDRREVPDHALDWQVARALPVQVGAAIGGPMEPVACEVDVYRRCILPGQAHTSVLVLVSIPFPAMMDRLVQQYTRQEAADDL